MSISGGLLTQSDAKEAVISARVIRADGTVEELGIVSYWHKNPIKRIWGNIKLKIGRLK